MDRVEAWLRERRPPAPEPVIGAVRSALASVGSGRIADVAHEAARARLVEALARPGRDREGAFALLAADALVTYACEAALDAPDASEALASILTIGKQA
jgi:hypothetical protein